MSTRCEVGILDQASLFTAERADKSLFRAYVSKGNTRFLTEIATPAKRPIVVVWISDLSVLRISDKLNRLFRVVVRGMGEVECGANHGVG